MLFEDIFQIKFRKFLDRSVFSQHNFVENHFLQQKQYCYGIVSCSSVNVKAEKFPVFLCKYISDSTVKLNSNLQVLLIILN